MTRPSSIILIKPNNNRASFKYNIRGKSKTITLPMGVICDVDLGKERVRIRNFWSGAVEKWVADSDEPWIKLTQSQMDKLMNNSDFKILEKWKPCI